jgi:non-canonical poly(A) RNA polymerase PAPD5/7
MQHHTPRCDTPHRAWLRRHIAIMAMIARHTHRYKKLPIKKLIIIRTARIPIIKLETTTRVTADISLGDLSGPRAANYVAQQV